MSGARDGGQTLNHANKRVPAIARKDRAVRVEKGQGQLKMFNAVMLALSPNLPLVDVFSETDGIDCRTHE